MEEFLVLSRPKEKKYSQELFELLDRLGYYWPKEGNRKCSCKTAFWFRKWLLIDFQRKQVLAFSILEPGYLELTCEVFLDIFRDLYWKYEWIKDNKNAIKILEESLSSEELLLFIICKKL